MRHYGKVTRPKTTFPRWRKNKTPLPTLTHNVQSGIFFFFFFYTYRQGSIFCHTFFIIISLSETLIHFLAKHTLPRSPAALFGEPLVKKKPKTSGLSTSPKSPSKPSRASRDKIFIWRVSAKNLSLLPFGPSSAHIPKNREKKNQ